jgi:sec-independent protein translocase protein TatC
MALVPFPSPQSGALPVPPDDDDDIAAEGKMSFLEHLDELRKRIVNSAIAIALCVVAGFYWINQIVDFILAPTRKALPPGVKLIYTQPGEAFSLYVQIALIMGVVLAAPYIMYQVWMFIAPGLCSNEKRLAIPFVLFTTIGFLLGAAFNHYIAFRS